jgi:hypothetical protein
VMAVAQPPERLDTTEGRVLDAPLEPEAGIEVAPAHNRAGEANTA